MTARSVTPYQTQKNPLAAGLGKEKPPRWAVCGGEDAGLVEQRPAAQRWQAGI